MSNIYNNSANLRGNIRSSSAFKSVPIYENDLVNKKYVDNQIDTIESGLDWQDSVFARTNTTPESPSTGDRYLIIIGSGLWIGQNDSITEWDGVEWIFISANPGMASYVENESVIYLYDGAAWNSLNTSGTTLQIAYNNSTSPEITTNNSIGSLSIKQGSGLDTDKVFEILDSTNSSKFFVEGTGNTVIGNGTHTASQPSTLTATADYSFNENLSISDGLSTGTLNGSATVGGGNLLMSSDTVAYCDYSGAFNANTAIQIGCIRIGYIPNYTGLPSSLKYLFVISKAVNDATNLISLLHGASGIFQLSIKDSTNTTITTTNFPVWSPTSGVLYDIELNYDLTTGVIRLFIDGVQIGSTITVTGTRDSSIDLIRVGNNQATTPTTTTNSNVSYFSLFDAVQHTINYTPDSGEYSDSILSLSFANTNKTGFLSSAVATPFFESGSYSLHFHCRTAANTASLVFGITENTMEMFDNKIFRTGFISDNKNQLGIIYNVAGGQKHAFNVNSVNKMIITNSGIDLQNGILENIIGININGSNTLVIDNNGLNCLSGNIILKPDNGRVVITNSSSNDAILNIQSNGNSDFDFIADSLVSRLQIIDTLNSFVPLDINQGEITITSGTNSDIIFDTRKDIIFQIIDVEVASITSNGFIAGNMIFNGNTFSSSSGDIIVDPFGNNDVLVNAQLIVSDDTLPPLKSERLTSATSSQAGSCTLLHTTTGNMVDNFGPILLFAIKDNALVDNFIGSISSLRKGADNSGRLLFNNYILGVETNFCIMDDSTGLNLLNHSIINVSSVSVDNITIDGNTISSTTGNINLNASGDTFIDTKLYITDLTGTALFTERISTVTNIPTEIVQVKHTTSADMTSGFGTGIGFHIEDSAAADNHIGSIECVRGGADNTGILRFNVDRVGVEKQVCRFEHDGTNSNIYFPDLQPIGSGTEMRINTTTGQIYSLSSSIRFKEDVKDLTYGLKEILSIKPKTYKFKKRQRSFDKNGNLLPDRVNETCIGIIAEELESIIPECINYEPDLKTVQGLTYVDLVPVLINSVKELHAIVIKQQNEIKKLIIHLGL